MTRFSFLRTWTGLSLLFLTVLAVTGCNHGTGETAPRTASFSKQQIMDARIKDIQNNPSIPPEDKARSIAAMQAQMGGSGTPAATSGH